MLKKAASLTEITVQTGNEIRKALTKWSGVSTSRTPNLDDLLISHPVKLQVFFVLIANER